ncbi:DUF3108 domain-containing protein [Bdellovibrio bacteriovorus]|uniref:DUF3108 domain-containing protein n=1 Tax=Bdellovibrio TaxID=958 RepID=UPI0035A95FBB
MKFSALLGAFFSVFMLVSCSTSFLKYEKADQLKKMEEFDQAVKIVKPQEPPPETATTPEQTPTEVKTPVAKKVEPKAKAPAKKDPTKVIKKTGKAATKAEPEITRRQPDIEDDAGFEGRRPIKDPFRVGEEVVHDVHYFKVSAGELRLKVEPFSMVNNRKSYTFAIEIRTSSLFSTFYSVEDRAETFVDYEDLVPRVFQLHVKESKQLREAKMLFDTEKNVAKFWEKKVTTEDGEEEKKQEWEILPYTQNVYSAIYYMRNFQWEPGKEYSFRVANDNENLVFSGKAVRREVLETKLGPMKAIVIQPTFFLKGKFKPIGDNFIWLSDDDRRYILRIESKIKIGTLVSEVVSINPGKQ